MKNVKISPPPKGYCIVCANKGCVICRPTGQVSTERENWRAGADARGVRMRPDGRYFGEPVWCAHGASPSNCPTCKPPAFFRGFSGIGI